MKLSKLSVFVVVLLLFAVSTFVSCSQRSDRHWGQKLDIDKSWWKMEGQSWDRDKNVFMAVGHSNPNWTDKYDMRKSADLDARAQVAQFMASLVKTYSEEVRSFAGRCRGWVRHVLGRVPEKLISKRAA
jgi:hypothetical protein